ncbi:MAG TPA: SDR family oxidoreductase [Burkholderiaceae bacterium]|nr:SDR family oxidoreductase [Burkholderiaceae bacterium]
MTTESFAIDYQKMFDLSGRVVLVVGGGSGIGRAACLGVAAAGAECVVADVDMASARETVLLVEAAGGQARAEGVDVRSTFSVDAMVDRTEAWRGRIDALITTPAKNLRKRLLDYTDADFDQVIDLNLKGSFRVARAVGTRMKAQGHGAMVLMSSMRAYSVEPGQSIYASTKAGIGQMAKGLATELAPYGVRVNAIAPGIIDTPLTAPIVGNPGWNQAYAARTALKRWAHVSEMAGPLVFLVSDAASYITATVIHADAGWTTIDGRYDPPV